MVFVLIIVFVFVKRFSFLQIQEFSKNKQIAKQEHFKPKETDCDQ